MLRLLSAADVITLFNAVMGLLALLMILSGHLWYAALLILLGLLADGLDGMVARRLGNGHIGEYLESIADMVSLSIAPLLLVYKIFYDTVISDLLVHLFFSGILVFSFLCSVIRLSSFSLMKEKHVFVGLPTSASAMFLVLVSLLPIDFWYALPVILVLSLAMISPLRFPKPGLRLNLITAVLILTTIVLNSMYYNIAPWLFLIGLMVYIVIGPVLLFLKKRKVSGTGRSRS
jgi:archaetidylserine synthase